MNQANALHGASGISASTPSPAVVADGRAETAACASRSTFTTYTASLRLAESSSTAARSPFSLWRWVAASSTSSTACRETWSVMAMPSRPVASRAPQRGALARHPYRLVTRRNRERRHHRDQPLPLAEPRPWRSPARDAPGCLLSSASRSSHLLSVRGAWLCVFPLG